MEEESASQMPDEEPASQTPDARMPENFSGSPRSSSRSPRSPPAGRKRAAVVVLASLVDAAKRVAVWQRDIEELEKAAGGFLKLGLRAEEIQRAKDEQGEDVDVATRRTFLKTGLTLRLAEVEELKGDILRLIV